MDGEFYTKRNNEVAFEGINNININLKPGMPLVEDMIHIIKLKRPVAYSVYKRVFKGDHFRIVKQFIKCNLGQYDGNIDLENGNLHYEFIYCPLRGEGLCPFEEKGCNPAIEFGLSIQEVKVAKLIAEGFTDKEVGERLFISHHTANQHRKNILEKIEGNNKQDITRFVIQYNL